MRSVRVGCLIAAGLFASTAVMQSAQDEARVRPSVRSVNDGVYNAAQARRGEATFGDQCGSCHEPERFLGRSFVDTWRGSLDALFNSIRRSMPEDNPGGLSPQVYEDVIAYLLKLNGYPVGP